jgi:hypothetical protein
MSDKVLLPEALRTLITVTSLILMRGRCVTTPAKPSP